MHPPVPVTENMRTHSGKICTVLYIGGGRRLKRAGPTRRPAWVGWRKVTQKGVILLVMNGLFRFP